MFVMCGQVSAQTETSLIAARSVLAGPLMSGKASPAAGAKISVVALEKFSRDYKGVKNVEWMEVANGYRAYFSRDAEVTAVDYTKKGKLYSVIRYGMHLLSPGVKIRLEKMFDGLQIVEVAEVKIAEFAEVAVVVVLEDSTSVKTVQIIKGEVVVVSEVVK